MNDETFLEDLRAARGDRLQQRVDAAEDEVMAPAARRHRTTRSRTGRDQAPPLVRLVPARAEF